MAKRHKLTKKEKDARAYKRLMAYIPITNKIGVYVCLFCAIVILAVGIFLTVVSGVSTSYTFSKYGSGPYSVSMNGPTAIFVGLFVLGLFFLFRRSIRKKENPE